MDPETQDQIIDLQSRIAEQEIAIDALSDMQHQHWQKIDQLTVLVEQLRKRLLNFENDPEGNPQGASPNEPPPPHY